MLNSFLKGEIYLIPCFAAVQVSKNWSFNLTDYPFSRGIIKDVKLTVTHAHIFTYTRMHTHTHTHTHTSTHTHIEIIQFMDHF